MTSIGGKIIDFYDDIYMDQFRKMGVIEKIADCQVLGPKELSSLPDSMFGVVFVTKTGQHVRKFPIHDEGHTVLASSYFEQNHRKLPAEAKVASATMIKKACEIFCVEPSESINKFAADAVGGNYVDLRQVVEAQPISKVAHTYDTLLEEYRDNATDYPREEKIRLARSMSKVAKRLGKSVPEDLRKFAHSKPSVDSDLFHQQCAARKELLGDDFNSKHVLDEFIEKQADFTPSETIRLLETFDKENGLDKYWDRHLDPYEILVEKVASHDLVYLEGKDFAKSDVASYISANKSLLRKMFDRQQLSTLSKDPASVGNLPSKARQMMRVRIENWIKERDGK